jgi:hypothetical protein
MPSTVTCKYLLPMFRRLLCPAGRFFCEMTEPAAVAAGAPVGHDPTKWPITRSISRSSRVRGLSWAMMMNGWRRRWPWWDYRKVQCDDSTDRVPPTNREPRPFFLFRADVYAVLFCLISSLPLSSPTRRNGHATHGLWTLTIWNSFLNSWYILNQTLLIISINISIFNWYMD